MLTESKLTVLAFTMSNYAISAAISRDNFDKVRRALIKPSTIEPLNFPYLLCPVIILQDPCDVFDMASEHHGLSRAS